MLLDSASLKENAKSWPTAPANHARPQNLLFYEDPDYRFVINGLIKRPGEATAVHDHAHTWTVYSVLEGEERVVRYRRAGAALVEDGDYLVRPGFIDIVPPHMIHAEYAGPARTVAVIVRSEKVGRLHARPVRPRDRHRRARRPDLNRFPTALKPKPGNALRAFGHLGWKTIQMVIPPLIAPRQPASFSASWRRS